MNGFDNWIFKRGEKLVGDIPKNVIIELKPGSYADLMGNRMGWLMASKKLCNFILQTPENNVQILPITVYLDGKPVAYYSVINPLDVIDAISSRKKDKSEISNSEMVIDSKTVNSNIEIFRLAQQPWRVVVSDVLIERMKNQGLKGVAAIPLKSK
jgi:hypothetical protein